MPTAPGTARSFDIPRFRQKVFVSGVLRPEFEASQCSYGISTAGSTCAISAPGKVWDDRERLKGKSVEIYCGYGTSSRNVFNGVITGIHRNTASNSVSIECLSWIAISDKTLIGQGAYDDDLYTDPDSMDYGLRVIYRYEDGWRVTSILRDIFGATAHPRGVISNDWRQLIKLGSLSDISAVDSEVAFGAIEFNRTSLRDGLQDILSQVGNIQFSERFENGVTYLDFWSERLRPVVTPTVIKVLKATENSPDADALGVEHGETIDQACSRIIAFGDYRKLMITLFDQQRSYIDDPDYTPPAEDYHGDGSELTDPFKNLGLRRGWDPDDEVDVLLDPEILEDDHPDYVESRKDTFRKFYIPDWFRAQTIDDDNVIQVSDVNDATHTEHLPIQAFRFVPRLRYYDAENAGTVAPADEDLAFLQSLFPTLGLTSIPAGTYVYTWRATEDEPEPLPTGLHQGQPQLLEGVKFNLKSGYFLTDKPVIELLASVPHEGKDIKFYAPVMAGITFTYNSTRLAFDTKVREGSVEIEALSSGLTESFTNENFRFSQVTNTNYPVKVADNTGKVTHSVTYGTAVYFVPGTNSYTLVQEATVYEDSSEEFASFVRKALQEKNRASNNYSVQTPYWTGAYRLGMPIQIVGEDSHEYGNHVIKSLQFNLTAQHGVTLGTDDSVPLLASNVLSAAVEPMTGASAVAATSGGTANITSGTPQYIAPYTNMGGNSTYVPSDYETGIARQIYQQGQAVRDITDPLRRGHL